MDWKSTISVRLINAVIAALICMTVGMGVGVAWTGRYQFRTYGGMPMRCDRWTGEVEIVIPKIRPILSQSTRDIFDQIAPGTASTKREIDPSTFPDQPTSTPNK